MIDLASDLLTTSAAATALGVQRQRVDQLRAEGRLVGVRLLNRWAYERSDVARLAAEREAARTARDRAAESRATGAAP